MISNLGVNNIYSLCEWPKHSDHHYYKVQRYHHLALATLQHFVQYWRTTRQSHLSQGELNFHVDQNTRTLHYHQLYLIAIRICFHKRPPSFHFLVIWGYTFQWKIVNIFLFPKFRFLNKHLRCSFLKENVRAQLFC